MRILFLFIILFSFESVKSQTIGTFGVPGYSQRAGFLNTIPVQDSLSAKKWFVSKYTGISTGISFYKGGRATFLAAPMALQLNRRLNNNVYAYANVAVVPSFTRLNPGLLNTGMNKPFGLHSFGSNSFQVNPSASVGLMYVNDAKTFSISGGFSVERRSYQFLPYYPPAFPKNQASQAK